MISSVIKNIIKKIPYIKKIFIERDKLWEELKAAKVQLNAEIEKQEFVNKSDNNRYAQDWNEYSKNWNKHHSSKYAHLGDEWNDDGTLERKRDNFYFSAYADRFIQPNMSVLEIGPGGGKWTIRIAPKVKKMLVLDVAEEMLKNTKQRCDSIGIKNIEYILGNGKDFQPIKDESIDFFFSYDVFVHIALEDTWEYSREMARVLAPGGVGVCHYAINSTPEAWERIEQNNDWYRFGTHTLGQYYYYSPEMLRRMFEHSGLCVIEQHLENCYCTCVFEKPTSEVVPKLEVLLKQLISQEANEKAYRSIVVKELLTLPELLQNRLKDIIADAGEEDSFPKRALYAAEIRRIWRGL